MRVSLSSLLGTALEGVFAAILLVRRPRPIHPHGVVLGGIIRWLPHAAPSGVAWIDCPVAEGLVVTARASRSIGLPPPLPDIIGLSFQFSAAHGVADIELASTGFGVPSRFWLAPQRSPSRAHLSTLFPYRSLHGPVLIGARTVSPVTLPVHIDELAIALEHLEWKLRLFHATPTGKWRPFAEMTLRREPGSVDTDLRFNAVRNCIPGAESYEWAR
ncbi:MAG: hypothetical protein JWP30_1917, partial [Homoserinimonas sp.]|nr:hypothetical protein [Homoserinimonas sp.]